MDSQSSSRRQRVSAEERNRILDLFRKSGLTQAAFAEQQGIKLTTLQHWFYKSSRRPRAAKKFQEVPLHSILSPTWAAEMVLKSGVTLRLNPSADPHWVRSLLPALHSC
jgi:transposase-like protein